MSQPARVYRILIAAPPDLAEARAWVDRCLRRWNNENFRDRRVILLPVSWDSSEGTLQAQRDLLRRDAAGGCDVFIGLFWTRLAASVSGGNSDLLETIDTLRGEGVPVLLFFSKERVPIDEIDPTELARLLDFRRQQNSAAQVYEYSDLLQLEEVFTRTLDQQIRLLLAAESLAGEGTTGASRASLDLRVAFADPSSGHSSGERLALEAKYFDIRNFDQIPDYQRPDGSGAPMPSLWGVMYNQANRDYYRNYIKYVFQGSMLRPVRLIIENAGLIGVRDVRVEVSVRPAEGAIFCIRPDQRLQRPDKEIGLADATETPRGLGFPIEHFTAEAEVEVLQPQRSIALPPLFLLGAERNVVCHVDVQVFADALAQPLRQRLTVDLQVKRESVDALEFFEVLRDR